jgi:molybdenum cofactor guanylyltransferase
MPVSLSNGRSPGRTYDEGVEFGGVVLAGGRSSRMGTAKAALEWHGSTLLYRTVAIVARATGGPVVIVRASGQELPELPVGVTVVDDPREGKGPVQGIAAGLAALDGQADAAFVTSTDLPFLHPAFIGRVLRALTTPDGAAPGGLVSDGAAPGDVAPGGAVSDRVLGAVSDGGVLAGPDVVLPVARGYRQPLAAAYRTRLAGLAERLVREDQLKPAFLFQECAVTTLDDAALLTDPLLAKLDPDLDSVRNVNTPEDYQAARLEPAPEVTVQLFGALARAGRVAGPRQVRAATVQAAADAAGLPFDRHVAAALNGDQITRDPRVPLAVGDTVYFMSADAGG